FDLSYLRCVPNMVIMAPVDEDECHLMFNTGFNHPGPSAIRYPRGSGPGVKVSASDQSLPLGKGVVTRSGQRVAILAFGSMMGAALLAAEKLDATVANMRFIKPLDNELILELAATHELLVSLEENAVSGGAGSGINELLNSQGCPIDILNLGLPDAFTEHGSRDELLAACGLTSDGILHAIEAYYQRQACQISNATLKSRKLVN
ncbi:MAG: 1-deoxy-D-xylulose-5-phosphate synthase, partial [Gammaproteobacteria bacterium]|nr:1-deoxy-D-xylulose-5-phosphate synthase [Gammaproteobacteria bacterium]